jgi:hypothetical protein
MTAHTAGPAPHLGDGELLRLLDRADEDGQLAQWETHIAGCERCAREVALLRDDAGNVRDWLGRAAFEDDLPAVRPSVRRNGAAVRRPVASDSWPPARSRPALAPWLRVAALLALLAAPLAAVPAVREWVAQALGATAGTPAATPESANPSAQTATGTPIHFAPAGPQLDIRIDAAQSRGELVVRRGSGGEARFEAAGAIAAGAVVSATGVTIRNVAGDRGSYLLEVPAHVNRVTVQVGSRRVVLDAASIERGTSVPLREN